jgi:O-antigen ligase
MYCIVIALYSRIAPDEAPAYLSRLFFRLALIPIILVLIVLPLAPDLAFADLDDATGVITGRLGGSMFYPNMLALLANTIVFYSYLLKTGWRRIGGMAFGATVLFFTYSRSGMISLVVCLFLLLLLYGNVWRRVFGIGIVSAGVLGIMAYSGKIVEFLARGHGDDNLSTLSERVQVWMASYEMFRQRPFSGYGYIAGPKEWLGIYVGSAHWMPPHAHNELIQAVLCAGIFGGLALLLLYLLVIRAAFRLDYSRRENVFLAVVLVALLLSSIVAPLLTRESTLEAALFLLLSVHLLNLPRHQEKANASTA